MTQLHLPDVTLICVDTRTPDLALEAMRRSMEQVRFGQVILFSDATTIADLPAGIDGVEVMIDSILAYSTFMLRGLLPHIATSHVLVVQWDGYVVDAAQWDPKFLEYDYIGALLRGVPTNRMVGNGGFSLRSRRLLEATQDPEFVIENPEDLCICHTNRERLEEVHDIRIAPADLAQHFSYERIKPSCDTFGFHGLFNMHEVLSSPELDVLLRQIPDQVAHTVDARDLCRTLIGKGQLEAAGVILAKRKALGLWDNRTFRLRWQHSFARLNRLVRRQS